MKKSIILAIIIIILIISLTLFILRVNKEDVWIKQPNGIYIKHGNPSSMPEEVKQQKEIINCANNLYIKAKNKMNLSSQCLGKCESYSIDIVHNPRTEEDSLNENQCQEYKNGITKNFLELDKNGNLIRIV